MDEHLETKSKGDAPRDFLDVYLDEMNNQTGTNENTTFTSKKNPKLHYLDYVKWKKSILKIQILNVKGKQLVGTIQDLFAAGSVK